MKNKIFLLLVVLTLVFCFLSACGDKNPAKTKHEHSLVLVDEVEATEESEGQRAHYICSDCGEIYLDPRGKHPATQEELITDKLAHVHSLAFVKKVNATLENAGVKEHYYCSKCEGVFGDEQGKSPIGSTDLIIPQYVRDETISMSYIFKGDEKTKAGYAQGDVTFTKTTSFLKDDTYDFYWGHDDNALEGYLPIYSKIFTSSTKNLYFALPENVCLPYGAEQIVVYKNGEFANCFDMQSAKVYTDANVRFKYAVISDVHMNNMQGEKHLLNALNRFEEVGVQYVILTGDIGETNNDYAKYNKVCKDSDYTGLIFACLGNHDQTYDGRINFKNSAVYDGKTKRFVSLCDLEDYFANTYSKELPIKAVYTDMEGNGNTYYYYVVIGDNLYFFMDQMLSETLGSSTDDNFTDIELDYLENVLHKYSGIHEKDGEFSYDKYNLFVIEHAPFEQFKVGDKYPSYYGGQLKLSPDYPKNERFVTILKEYYEAVMLTGHTHTQYSVAVNYTDKYYDAYGTLTDTPLARTFHVSSVAQPRWYDSKDKKKMIMLKDYSAGSECYIVNQYENDIVFTACRLKDYTPDNGSYDPLSYEYKLYAAYSYIIPTMTNEHYGPIPRDNYASADHVEVISGTPVASMTGGKLLLTFTEGDSLIFKMGNQTNVLDRDGYFEFVVSTNVTLISVFGSDYSGNIKRSITLDLTKDGTDYLVTKKDGELIIQIKASALAVESASEFAFGISDINGDLAVSKLAASALNDYRTRGKHFTSDKGFSLTKLSTQPVKGISFEYRIDNGGKMRVQLLDDDWDKGYGPFIFSADGSTEATYSGVTVEKLDYGYYRVTIDFTDSDIIVKHGKTSYITILDIWQTLPAAEGYIDNVVIYS